MEITAGGAGIGGVFASGGALGPPIIDAGAVALFAPPGVAAHGGVGVAGCKHLALVAYVRNRFLLDEHEVVIVFVARHLEVIAAIERRQ